MPSTFTELVFCFTVYSIIGWICEMIWCGVIDRKVVNRGFLQGPYLPIYGFGAILILWSTQYVLAHPWLVFLITALVSTVLEYATSWLLEALFQLRWWDYSHKRFNLRGRVCLENTILFGLLSLPLVYILQPWLNHFLHRFDPAQTRVVAALIIVVFVIDLTRTLDTLAKLNEKLKSLHLLFNELKSFNKEQHWLVLTDLNGSATRLREICQSRPDDPQALAILARLNAIMNRRDDGLRILAAFPNIASTKLDVEIMGVRIYLANYRRKWSKLLVRHLIRLKIRSIRLARDLNPFAQGVGFYKLVWVFLVASVLGFFIETMYCWAINGYIESRQGMLYGPFSQIYGFGAVLMVLLLNRFSRKSVFSLFIAGAVLGGLYEIGCSMLQEFVVGTVSWSYTESTIGLAGGRTSLVYMLYWGILAVIYMRLIYPRISRMIERIPTRPGVFFSWVIVLVLCVDMTLSVFAVIRWNDRLNELPAATAFGQFLDRHYPNNLMNDIYPNMQHRKTHAASGQPLAINTRSDAE